MKAIKINPWDKTIKEIEIGDSLQDIYDNLQAQAFDLIRIDYSNWIYVDDMGLYKQDQAFFVWDGYPQPLAGYGLVLGDQESTTWTVANVQEKVTWLDDIA